MVEAEILLRLPDALRAALKEPRGRIYDDAAALAVDAGSPLVAVGDVVTYHLLEAGTEPAVALVDGRTEREAATGPVRAVSKRVDRSVANPAATLTADLLRALRAALEADGPVRIGVDGEEDLAAVPAIVATPVGGSVVYGQPGEGMVLVAVTAEAKAWARDLLSRMDGDADRALALLEG